jgi:methionine aminopeptidase
MNNDYKIIQTIAKSTINYLKKEIRVGMSEKEIAVLSNNYMQSLGVESFWWYGIGSMVLIGKRSILSENPLDYKPSNNILKEGSVVNIDLSPCINGINGDFARTFFVENGLIKSDSDEVDSAVIKEGLLIEKMLHSFLLKIVTQETIISDFCKQVNALLEKKGFKNLDFRNNFGHSINCEKVYIDENNNSVFGSLKFFTFEPHITKDNINGFKYEDIYYFKDGKLNSL